MLHVSPILQYTSLKFIKFVFQFEETIKFVFQFEETIKFVFQFEETILQIETQI